MTNGHGHHLDLNGMYMTYVKYSEYYFGLTYLSAYTTQFGDCRNSYKNNINQFAISLT